MSKQLPLLVLLCCLTACNVTPEVAAPASFVSAVATPTRPTDAANPLAAVIWTLNYDLRQFDTVWTWLHTDVPAGPERSRAIGAAALIAVAELDRLAVIDDRALSLLSGASLS